MIDGDGNALTSYDARTGPGSKNVIRLKLEVLKMHVSSDYRTPKSVRVPLDNFMHFSLGQIQEAHADASEEFLVFLRSEKYQPIIAGRFLWSLDDLEEALKIHRECEAWR